jgi:hypothetical protein
MYQPLPQSESDDLQTQRTHSRRRSRSLDLSKLDSAFKKWVFPLSTHHPNAELGHANRWTENISQRMKALGKKRKDDPHQRREILRSVFDPPISYPGFVPQDRLKTLDHNSPISNEDYKAFVFPSSFLTHANRSPSSLTGSLQLSEWQLARDTIPR